MDLRVDTLDDQFRRVRYETNTSHVTRYWDTSFSHLPVRQFLGMEEGKSKKTSRDREAYYACGRNESVPVSSSEFRLICYVVRACTVQKCACSSESPDSGTEDGSHFE